MVCEVRFRGQGHRRTHWSFLLGTPARRLVFLQLLFVSGAEVIAFTACRACTNVHRQPCSKPSGSSGTASNPAMRGYRRRFLVLGPETAPAPLVSKKALSSHQLCFCQRALAAGVSMWWVRARKNPRTFK